MAGRRLGRLAPLYDAAIGVLDRAQRRIATGEAKAHRRLQAHLRLARFWFQANAFHLEALALYVREIERFFPKGRDPGEEFVVTYIPTIRMSDCLDGYARRRLPPSKERDFPSPYRELPGSQSNVLALPESDPDYRARRDLDQVLKHLDPRLERRALRLIEAARDVMRNEGRSPWGWMVYYSEIDTFVWKKVRYAPGPVQRPGKDRDGGGPVTPRGGGSTPGGPRTR